MRILILFIIIFLNLSIARAQNATSDILVSAIVNANDNHKVDVSYTLPDSLKNKAIYIVIDRTANAGASGSKADIADGTHPLTYTDTPQAGEWNYVVEAFNSKPTDVSNLSRGGFLATGSNSVSVSAAGTTTTGNGTADSGSCVTTLFGTHTCGAGSLNELINALITWVAYRIGPGVVLLMIIYAGFQYIASKGDPALVKAAKDRIVGTIIGFIILMLIGTIMRGFFL